jgi:chromatin segregation and condensation protein Rec8/ScpA/Scc1 (kleisin family)
VTFLASLELARLRKLRVHQEEAYSEIYLELLETLSELDLKLASGFDSIEQASMAPTGNYHV